MNKAIDFPNVTVEGEVYILSKHSRSITYIIYDRISFYKPNHLPKSMSNMSMTTAKAATTMLAAVLHNPGPPSALTIQRVPLPTPTKPTDVLIRVRAFGLNRSELYTRQGLSGPAVPLPRVLGIEAVGTLESVPDPNPTNLQHGDVVVTIVGGMGRTFDGGYAEYTVVPASNVHAVDRSIVPSDVTNSAKARDFWTILGSLPETYQTAWGCLVKVMGTEPDDTLFIRGGTSTIGLAAAAIAKHKIHCRRVVATTRSPAKAEELKKTGNVDEVIIELSSSPSQLAPEVLARYPEKFTKVLDLVGCSTLRDSLKCTAFGGTVCSAGFTGDVWQFDSSLPDGGVFNPERDLPIGVCLTFFGSNAKNLAEMPFDEYLADALAGKLRMPVLAFEGLDQVVMAHEKMEASSVTAKMVVLVP